MGKENMEGGLGGGEGVWVNLGTADLTLRLCVDVRCVL